jgi:hypothetical protein
MEAAVNGNIQSVAQVDGKVIVYLRKKEVGPLPQNINGMPIEYKIVSGIAPALVKYFDQQSRSLRELTSRY